MKMKSIEIMQREKVGWAGKQINDSCNRFFNDPFDENSSVIEEKLLEPRVWG
jgi:hypothetical protein